MQVADLGTKPGTLCSTVAFATASPTRQSWSNYNFHHWSFYKILHENTNGGIQTSFHFQIYFLEYLLKEESCLWKTLLSGINSSAVRVFYRYYFTICKIANGSYDKQSMKKNGKQFRWVLKNKTKISSRFWIISRCCDNLCNNYTVWGYWNLYKNTATIKYKMPQTESFSNGRKHDCWAWRGPLFESRIRENVIGFYHQEFLSHGIWICARLIVIGSPTITWDL